jgi:site-specific DNA recombinase
MIACNGTTCEGRTVMIAAIYARKSTEQAVSDDQKSIARQVDHARQYAARKGWTVDDAYVFVDDGISGAEFANRPGFLRLMNSVKPRAPFQALIMSEESRLGREAIETAYALKQLVQAGVRVFFYMEDRERTLDSPTDKIMLSLTTFADELEREKARQRTYDAMTRKAKSGHVTGGRVFGYDNVEIAGPDGIRSHVMRRINEAEAAIVRQIYERCAAGSGVRGIAKALNDARALAPRSQQGRPRAWAPSSVHEVLRRSLYHGEITWNRTRKRNRWGQQQQTVRPDSEWMSIDAPELRIVPEPLWLAVHARLSEARAVYLTKNSGTTFGRPTNGSESKYLLTGFGQCAQCGSSLIVRMRKHGREHAAFYGCSGYHLRGTLVCSNRADVPMAAADAAVLDTLKADILNPAVLDAAIARAVERVSGRVNEANAQRQLEAELATAERDLNRLVAAVQAGADVPAVVSALKDAEGRRTRVLADIARLRVTRPVEAPDALRRRARAIVEDWQTVLMKRAPQTRRMVRSLLVGRLSFTPAGPKRWTFTGTGTLRAVLEGELPEDFLMRWRPQRDSNPRYRRERPASWASGRWGRSSGAFKATTDPPARPTRHAPLQAHGTRARTP